MSINRVNQQVIREYTARVQPTPAQTPGAQDAPRAGEAAAQPTRRADEIQLSVGGPELQRMREAVNSASDVREDRVAEIKRQLTEGTYQMNYPALAKKLSGIINLE
jgi:negative regulator of flagellin synthesis FlgM